jgi:CRISPR-associated protein Cas5t
LAQTVQNGHHVALFVSVPVASFRNPYAREYLETYPCPPPSTVYGMLLSASGEVSRRAHCGAEIAYALLSTPELSTVIRTKWRVKSKQVPQGLGKNKVPDYQELLTDVKLAIWVRKGKTEAAPSLAERLVRAVVNPATTDRFGALSLGESTHLVDDFRFLREGDGIQGALLVRADDGDLSLPVWADHVSSRTTRWVQSRLVRYSLEKNLSEQAWITITPGDI